MKNPLLITLFIIALLPLAVQADTFVLKNGDKVKASLLRETADTYVVEVSLAPTIRDERVILKKDVVRIIKPAAGELEFKHLKDLLPAPDGLRAEEYEQRIELLARFIENFPANKDIRKAIAMRDELRAELSQVQDGAVKIAGVLYPAAELRVNQYELDARVEARKIKDLVNAGQHLQALRAYLDFQTEFNYTKVHLELIPLMQKLISLHFSQASQWRDTLDFRIEEREKGLMTMAPGDRRASERAIDEEKQTLLRLYRLETSTQAGWVSMHPFCKEALDHTVQFAKSELRKIDNLLSKDFTDGGAIYREVYQMQKQGADDKMLRDKVRILQKLGVPARYIQKFALAL
ncbi:MAG: PTPDL family protein [Luteolibacter sp.]